MEATVQKRKYQKHKSGGKITINHYLNLNVTDFRAYPDDSGNAHPLYIQIIVKRMTTNIKSLAIHGTTMENFKNSDWWELVIERESENIKTIISEELNPFTNPEFRISDIGYTYSNHNRRLTSLVDRFLQREIYELVNRRNPEFESHTGTLDVKGLILIDYFKEFVPEVTSLRETLSSGIWHFDYYFQNFVMNGTDSGKFVYTLLPPIDIDFENGNFHEEFLRFYKKQEKTISKLLIDMEFLFEKHKEELAQLKKFW